MSGTTLDSAHKCEGSVRVDTNWPRYTPCNRPGKVERDGKWWCGIHDPLARQAKRDKRQEEFNARMEFERREGKIRWAAPALLAACEAALPWLEQRGNADVVAQVEAAIKRAKD